MQDRFYGMLGIAAKAGALSSGAFAAEQAVRSGRAWLLIVAADASEQTRRNYEGLCRGCGVEMAVCGDKERLGRAIGKDERAAIAVTNEKIAVKLSELCGSAQ